MKVLVTGGAGFIGANLIRALIEHTNYDIHVLSQKNTNPWRLYGMDKEIIIHEVDMADFARVRQLVLSIRPRIVFHLAAYGGMPNELDQKMIYDVNFYGTINLLNVCKEVGFDVFINTGSSSEYGKQDSAMHEDLVLEPVSDYAVAKAAATQFCCKEARVFKVPVYTIRPFSIYGDYELNSRLIPTILVGALCDKSIQLSAPHYVRDYMYIKDLISLFLAIMQQKPDANYIFNAGTGVQTSIGHVVATVEHILGKKLSVQWGIQTPRPWEPEHWHADMFRTKKVLAWSSQYTLEEGLKESLAWFKKNISLYAKDSHEDKHVSHSAQSSSV